MRLDPRLHSAALVAAFFVAGGLIAGARRALRDPPALGELVVRVRAGASAWDRDKAREEALLVEYAILAGWARSDAVVRERLLHGASLVASGPPQSSAELVERAYRAGLHREDPIARQRLLSSARRALERPPGEPGVTPVELLRAVESGALGRWAAESLGAGRRAPPRLRLEPRFLSRDRRGAALTADAEAASAALAGPLAADASFDPAPVSAGWITPARLDALAGPGVGAQLVEAPLGVWTGPLACAHGVLFARVLEREEATPDLDRARAVVLERVRTERRKGRVEGAVAALERRFVVRWETAP